MRLTPGGAIVLVAVMAILLGSQLVGRTTAADDEPRENEHATSEETDVRKFSFGGQVELLAIGTPGEEPQRWWQADGTPLDSVTFPDSRGSYRSDDPSGRVWLELLFRGHDFPELARHVHFKWTTKSPISRRGTGRFLLTNDCQSYTFPMDKQLETFDLRVGVAAGQWRTMKVHNVQSGGIAHSAGGAPTAYAMDVVCAGVFPHQISGFGPGAVTIVTHNVNTEDYEVRVAATDKQGNKYTPDRWHGHPVGEVQQTKWVYPVEPDEIARLEFQTREIEWVEFKDLPVHPDEAKPAVEFSEIEAQPSSTNDQPAPKPEPDPSSGISRELRSGAKVKLLGIGTHGAKVAQWWNGDGKPLDNVPFKLEGPRGRPSDKVVAREAVFRVEGVPDDAVVRMETKPLDGGTPGEVVWNGKTPLGNYGGLMFFVPKDRETFKLRVGVAGGKWQTINTSELSGSQATGIAGGHGIVFSEAFGKGDDTVVIVSHNMENENTRVVAVDLAGSEFVGERAGYVSAVGEVNQAVWKFPDLLPESIKEFKFQTRLFLWADFDDLPVNADAAKPVVGFPGHKTEQADDKASTDAQPTRDQLEQQVDEAMKEKLRKAVAEAYQAEGIQAESPAGRQVIGEAMIDEAMKADPMISMLQQEIMTRNYWIMQLQLVSKRSNSPQIKLYQKQKAAMEEQIAEYRKQVKQQLLEQLKTKPFVVRGRVTDHEGKPMEGVVIRAATGIGTLRGGGSTVTDADGRYTLRFGPGMAIERDPENAPLGVGIQAAIISARKPSWYEVNLNRQGDLLMSDQPRESLKREDLWGKESIESVVFPNEPREVNFTLAPAVVIEGELVGDGTWEIENQSLSLTGDELPPAQSVFTSATTNQDGKFQMDAVPPGKPWRFQMRIDGTRGEVSSDPFTIAEPGVYRCVVSLDTEAGEDGSVVLKLRQEAAEMP